MDRRWVHKAADSGQDEVALAQLAAQRATNPEVKSFAERLVKDHTDANNELKSMAASKGITLDQDDGKDRTYRRMSGKSSTEFDQEFVEHMVDEHEDDIRRFEKASRDAKDTEVKSFASKHLPHLREHLQMAQRLQTSMSATGRMDSSTSPSTTGASSSKSSSSTSPSSTSTGTGTSSSKSGTGTGTGTGTATDKSNK
jgi:putative membrane protein